MEDNNNHNHFCIYCGARLVPGQKFCTECGHEVYHAPPLKPEISSKYASEVFRIEKEYKAKQNRAFDLVDRLFDPTHMSHEKFSSAIKKSNQLFANQLDITKKMIEMDTGDNELIERELGKKMTVLQTFIDKMEDLINELVIILSSNKKDDDDINNLFKDMDDLIGSVKDY